MSHGAAISPLGKPTPDSCRTHWWRMSTSDLDRNIVETAYDRAYHGVNLGDTAIDITMETRGPAHIAELIAALLAAGYAHERIL